MIRLLTVIACCLPLSAAYAQDAKPADKGEKAEKITYEQHILPLFREKCGSCHNANDKKGDLVLDNFGAAIRGGASGEVIRVDGDAENSSLYRVVAHLSEPVMPPGQKLPDDQIALIKKWIEGGSLENSGSTSKVKKQAMVAKVEVSLQRPAGPPPMPENLLLEPLLVSSRANGVTALATSPWAPLAAVSGHKQVLLYDTGTFELVGVLPFPEGQPHVLKFSRNGQLLMAGGGRGSHSGKVIVFEVKTGNRVAEVGDEYDVILAADLSPDQTMIALGGPKKIVRCYNIATGELMFEKNKHTDWITAIEFSPDGVLLATGDRSNGLFVWEAYTGREFHVLNGHQQAITDVSWSADGNLLASSCEDTTIKFWEMQNGGQVRNIGAHGGGTTAVEFLRDGRLVSFGRDVRAKLWDGAGANQRTFDPQGDIGTEIAHCGETDRVLVGDLTGQVLVYSAKDGAKIGPLTTNPPTIAVRIEQTQQVIAAAEAAVTQTAAQLAAVQKPIADRKVVADAAVKVAADAAAAVEPEAKAKAAADADLVAKTQVFTAAETTYKSADDVRAKAVADRETINKSLAENSVAAKITQDAITAAEAALTQAQQAAEANPADVALKDAVIVSGKKLAETLIVQAELTRRRGDLAQHLATKTEPVLAALVGVNAAKPPLDKAITEKAASEKLVAEAVVKLKAAQDLAAAKKAEADTAVAAAQPTPDEQKALDAASAAANAAIVQHKSAQDRLARLHAAQSRPAQQTAATN